MNTNGNGSLAKQILLLQFRERHFSPVITDKKITEEVIQVKGRKKGQFRKELFKEGTVPEHSAVVSAINSARRIFKDRTMVYSDGIGITPGVQYEETVDAINVGIIKVELCLDDYLPVYWNRVLEQEQYLEDDFNLGDYPSASEIRSRYGVTISVLPWPEGANLEVEGVPDLPALQESVEKYHAGLITGTVIELAVRFQEVLADLGGKLGTDKDLRNQSIERARQVATRVNGLNFTHHPVLTKIGEQITQTIDSWNLKDINKDDLSRAIALDSINDILATARAFA